MRNTVFPTHPATAQHMLSQEGGDEDFIKEKSLFEIEIAARGHECIFYPKSHCELNYIELL